mgnify:CR=1 FL=1
MKKFIGILVIILGITLGLYIGGWLLFVQPIIQACIAFDAGVLTGLIVGTTILKCIFASCVGTLIAYLGIYVGSLIMYSGKFKYKK